MLKLSEWFLGEAWVTLRLAGRMAANLILVLQVIATSVPKWHQFAKHIGAIGVLQHNKM